MLISNIIAMLSAASEPFETDKCGSNVRFLGFRAIFPDVKDVPECTVAAGAVPCDKLQSWFKILSSSLLFIFFRVSKWGNQMKRNTVIFEVLVSAQ